jgi:hypothetical protein
VRVAGSIAYYVSAGALHRVDLDTLTAVDMSQGDRISGSSLLFLDGNSNVHTFNIVTGSVSPLNEVRVYFADGSPYSTLGWGSPDGVLFCEDHIEDLASGKLYRVASAAGGLTYSSYTFDDAGIHIVGATVIGPVGLTERINAATGAAYLKDMLYADASHVASVSVDAEGNITGAVVRDTAEPIHGQPRTYADGKLYVAYESGTVAELDMASGTETALTSASGITDLEVVAGQVFYAKADGVYKYDPVAESTELVGEAGEIEAVTR